MQGRAFATGPEKSGPDVRECGRGERVGVDTGVWQPLLQGQGAERDSEG